MKTEVIWFENPVSYEEAWEDDRVPSGIFDEAVPAAEATEKSERKSNAWLFYRRVDVAEEEERDRREHHGKRDRAYHRAGF